MGSIVCFALFLGAVGVCLAEGWQLMWAIWAGIAVFVVLGLARHVPVRVMAAGAWRQGRKMCSVIDIYLLIGAITALWRSAGTIGFFIYHGLQIITPQMFLLVAFLLTSFISYALGTSFGVVGTVGVILMALARSGGVDAAVTAGTIIAGAYFGDRCSPASSSAALVAAATGTVLERNLRRMHRTGWLPYVVSLAVYAALSVTLWGQGGQLWDVLRDTVLGYRPAGGALQQVLAGGGVASMLTATLMAISAGMYAGLLDSAGVLDGVRHHAAALARRAGRFPACAAVCALAGMIFCNQSAGPVVADQLLEETYRARGQGGEELALDIENSGIVMAPLIPWNISVSIPLVMLGADASAIPYEVLLYAIPLCYLLTKRRVFAAKGERI